MNHTCMGEHRFSTVLVCLLMVTVGIHGSLVPTAYSAELSTSESSFFSEVLKLDMTKYNATKYIVQSKTGYFDDFGDLFKEEGDYVLECNGSKIHVMYILVNNTFSYFHLDVSEGSPIFAEQPSTNLIERTDAFLENYQSYLGNSEFQQYRDMLSTVSEVKDTAITVGNVRFEITQFSLGTRFRWVNTFNGADYTSFGISYRANSTDFAFGDDRYNRIGSTALNISKEQAIGIAMERVQNISWKVDGVEVGNVTILDNRTSVALLTAPKEPLVLYPYWQVSLTFDKIYPGSVYGVAYSIWADTGEVFYGFLRCFSLIPPEEPAEPPTEPNIIPEFPDIAPPTISILSPENKTYTTNSVSLSLEVDEATSWIGYSLDGQANLTLSENTLYISALSEHLTGLPDGTHSIVVYAEDTAGNTGTSETIYFTISQEPESQEPPPDDSTDQTNLDPTPLLIAIPVVLAVIVGVVFYKRKHSGIQQMRARKERIG